MKLETEIYWLRRLKALVLIGRTLILAGPCLACLHPSDKPQVTCGYAQQPSTATVAKMADSSRTHRGGDRTRDERSRSPRRHHSHSHRARSPHRHHHKRKRSPGAEDKALQFKSRELGKRDYDTFKPMFATYLDIQKQKILEDMDETEVRGRWKSFVGKW